jgi:uncharacterized damage-inducible protein DinB
MEPAQTYTYLMRSRERVFDSVRPLTPVQAAREFEFGLKSISSTLAHIMISEWYYLQRLESREVPAYEHWPIKYESPPSISAMETIWRAQAAEVLAYVQRERDWSRSVSWVSFPNEQGQRFDITTTAAGQLSQLVLHEVHHRAQLMTMLRLIGEGVPPLEDLDFNAMMYERRLRE